MEPCPPVHFTRSLGRENERTRRSKNDKLFQGANEPGSALKALQTLPLNPAKQPHKVDAAISPFYRWAQWGTERLSDLPASEQNWDLKSGSLVGLHT